MGEFDVSLIREFRSRPAFYDRNDASFKDKVYTAREWQEISNKLGYDVSLLKDRMLQLRNRYNLEKRRLEQLREENPGKPAESPWPLYDMLHFLSDHIRARRSYKRMYPLPNVTAELDNSASNPSSPYGGPACDRIGYESTITIERADQKPANMPADSHYANGMCAVKLEEKESDVESDSHSGADQTVGNHNVSMLAQAHLDDQHSMSHQHTNTLNSRNVNVALPSSITIRRLDTMRHAATASSLSSSQNVAAQRHGSKRNYSSLEGEDHDAGLMNKRTSREHKYAAFGNFISCSLRELPQNKALMLVEKFTSEIVKMLIQNNGTSEENASNDEMV